MPNTWLVVDGVQYEIEDVPGARHLDSVGGVGLPPVEHITSRGVYQDGETWIRENLRPRILAGLLHIHAGTPLAMEGEVEALAVRLAAFGRLIWLRLRSDGTYRQATVNYLDDGGMPWAASEGFGQRKIPVRVVAHDPLFYSPTMEEFIYSGGASVGSWIFGTAAGLHFPAHFGGDYVGVVKTCYYLGTWRTLPIIRLDGPITDPVIQNLTTGEELDFTGHTVANGEWLEIDCRYGYKTVTHSVSGNVISWLSTDSDLGTFHLAGLNESADGANDLLVDGSGTGVNTKVKFTYYLRYVSP